MSQEMMKSVVDRRVKHLEVGGKVLTITEPSAKKAREFFALQSQVSMVAATKNARLSALTKKVDEYPADAADYNEVVGPLREEIDVLFAEILSAITIADSRPILLILGDQVTEEWLEEEIGISQLAAIANAINEVLERKNAVTEGSPTPAGPQTPPAQRTVTALIPPQ